MALGDARVGQPDRYRPQSTRRCLGEIPRAAPRDRYERVRTGGERHGSLSKHRPARATVHRRPGGEARARPSRTALHLGLRGAQPTTTSAGMRADVCGSVWSWTVHRARQVRQAARWWILASPASPPQGDPGQRLASPSIVDTGERGDALPHPRLELRRGPQPHPTGHGPHEHTRLLGRSPSAHKARARCRETMRRLDQVQPALRHPRLSMTRPILPPRDPPGERTQAHPVRRQQSRQAGRLRARCPNDRRGRSPGRLSDCHHEATMAGNIRSTPRKDANDFRPMIECSEPVRTFRTGLP